jgi:hypothetical protein
MCSATWGLCPAGRGGAQEYSGGPTGHHGELYGRVLTDEESAMVGVDRVNEAIRREYEHSRTTRLCPSGGQCISRWELRLLVGPLTEPRPCYPTNWPWPRFVEILRLWSLTMRFTRSGGTQTAGDAHSLPARSTIAPSAFVSPDSRVSRIPDEP